jgi:hypothetical protein
MSGKCAHGGTPYREWEAARQSHRRWRLACSRRHGAEHGTRTNTDVDMRPDKWTTGATKLGEVMSTEPVKRGPEETLRDAGRLFADHDISGAPIVAAGKLAGVVSAAGIIAVEASPSGIPAKQFQRASRTERAGPTDGSEGAEPPPRERPGAAGRRCCARGGARVVAGRPRIRFARRPSGDFPAAGADGRRGCAGPRCPGAGRMVSPALGLALGSGHSGTRSC